MKFVLLLALIVSLAIAGSTTLTSDDFVNGKVTAKNGSTSNSWFVKFYNPRCPHCKKFAATWEKISDEFTGKDDMNFGSLDCAAYKPVCDRFNIWGVPTLLLFKDNHVLEYQNSNDYERVTDFLNQRRYDNDLLTERWPVPAA